MTGGFDLGFERAGFEIAWQVEIDPWCRRVLAKHFPEAERFEDVRVVGRETLRPVDVICGGFPCQDISNAGLRAGIDGKRSGLWSEYARIIGELRPRFVLVENVAALLGRGMGRVLGDLAAIGYDAEWEIVSASDAIETDHLRERVWILAYPNSDGHSQRDDDAHNRGQAYGSEFARGKSVGASPSETSLNSTGREFALGRAAGRVGRIGESVPWDRTWKITYQPTLDGTEDGIPKRLDRLRGLGNAVVPQIPEMYARRIMERKGDCYGNVRSS